MEDGQDRVGRQIGVGPDKWVDPDRLRVPSVEEQHDVTEAPLRNPGQDVVDQVAFRVDKDGTATLVEVVQDESAEQGRLAGAVEAEHVVWRRASPSGWAMTRVEPRSAASAACPTGRPSRPWAWVAGMSFGCRGGSPGSAASSEATGQPMRGTRSSTDSQSGQKNGVRTSCTARRPWPRSRSVMPGTSSTWKAAATPLMRVRARAS